MPMIRKAIVESYWQSETIDICSSLMHQFLRQMGSGQTRHTPFFVKAIAFL